VPEFGQLPGGGPVAPFGLVPEGEEGLLAAGRRPSPGDGENVVAGEIGTLAGPRRLGKGAVVADVAAELGEGDEHLAGVGNQVAVAAVPQECRRLEQGAEIRRFGEEERLRVRRLPAVLRC